MVEMQMRQKHFGNFICFNILIIKALQQIFRAMRFEMTAEFSILFIADARVHEDFTVVGFD